MLNTTLMRDRACRFTDFFCACLACVYVINKPQRHLIAGPKRHPGASKSIAPPTDLIKMFCVWKCCSFLSSRKLQATENVEEIE